MENSDIKPHASVFSRSALHSYITGPVSSTPPPKSAFNPYRKRAGLLGLVKLEAAEEAIQKSLVKTEEKQEVIQIAEATPTLAAAAAAT